MFSRELVAYIAVEGERERCVAGDFTRPVPTVIKSQHNYFCYLKNKEKSS